MDFDEVKEILRPVVPQIKDDIRFTELMPYITDVSSSTIHLRNRNVVQHDMPKSSYLFFDVIKYKPRSFVTMMAALLITNQKVIYDLLIKQTRIHFHNHPERLEEVLGLIKCEVSRIRDLRNDSSDVNKRYSDGRQTVVGIMSDEEVKEILKEAVPKIKDHINFTELMPYLTNFSSNLIYFIKEQAMQHGMPQSSHLFFEAIQQKPGSFVTMVAALLKTGQNEMCSLLIEQTRNHFVDNPVRLDEVLHFIRDEAKRIKAVWKESAEENTEHKNDTSLPTEILRMDKESIDLYKKALTEGKEAVYNIRVIVVGHIGVGKTVLTRRLLGQAVDINTKESTNGIDVHVRRCKVSLEDGQWTILQNNEKSENTCSKRLAKAVANQRVAERKDIHAESVVTDILEDTDTTTDNGSDIKDDMLANTTHIDEEQTIMNDMKELILEDSKSNLLDEKEFADLSIWDFAGQSAFYTTHQVFLSPRAVYLLVTDISKHIDDVVVEEECHFDSSGSTSYKISKYVEFWLNSIHGYCPSSKNDVPPVILIGTHADKLDKKKKNELSKAYFEALRNFLSGKVIQYHLADEDFVVDNTIADQILETLKKKIFEVASKQDNWGELIPAKWIKLEKYLDELRDTGYKIIERADIERINKDMPVPIETNQELQLFLRFHHESGNFLYFSDEPLQDYVLLDPQWLVDAFKCLITAKMFCLNKPHIYQKWQEFNQRAILKSDLIDAIWKNEENESFHLHRHHLIGLLERLDIIAKPYTINDEGSNTKVQDYFFAPCVLKDRPPSDILTPSQNEDSMSTTILCFTLSTQFVPTIIFNRLLVACISKWPISRQCETDLIYCGCGIFNVDPMHRLTLFFSENVIQIWVTNYSRKNPQPSSSICSEVRVFVEQMLRRIILDRVCLLSELEIFVKCPNVGVGSSGLFKLKDLLDSDEISCDMHEQRHVLATSEMLKFWFRETAMEIGPEVYTGLSFQTLERVPTEIELATMSKRIGKEFQHLALQLGLTQASIDQVKMDNPYNSVEQIMQILLKWKQTRGTHATFRELETAMRKADVDTVEAFKNIRYKSGV